MPAWTEMPAPANCQRSMPAKQRKGRVPQTTTMRRAFKMAWMTFRRWASVLAGWERKGGEAGRGVWDSRGRKTVIPAEVMVGRQASRDTVDRGAGTRSHGNALPYHPCVVAGLHAGRAPGSECPEMPRVWGLRPAPGRVGSDGEDGGEPGLRLGGVSLGHMASRSHRQPRRERAQRTAPSPRLVPQRSLCQVPHQDGSVILGP